MRSLGIDIGERSIKIVEIEFSGKKRVVTGAYQIERSIGDQVQGLLLEFFQAGAVKPDRICVGLGNTPVFLKQVSFPFGDKKKVEQALIGEFEDILPVDIEDYIVEFQKLKKTGRNHHFLAGLISQKHVEGINHFFENTSFIPNDYSLSSEALARLGIEFVGREEEPGTKICVCDIGFRSTNIAVLEVPHYSKKKPTAADYAQSILELRTIGRGAHDLYTWLDRSKAMSYKEVDEWLLNRAEIKGGRTEDPALSDETSDEIKTALRPLLVEIYQTIQAFSSKYESKPDYYMLTGNLAQLKGFEEFFAQELRSQIVRWDAFQPFDMSQVALTSEQASTFTTALALANRYGAAKAIPWLNFRRSSHATKRVLSGFFETLWSDEFRPIIFGLLLAIFVVLGVYSASSFFIGKQVEKVASEIRVELKTLRVPISKSSAQIAEDPAAVRSIYERFKKNKLKENVLETGTVPRTEMLLEVSNALPNGFKINEMDVVESADLAKLSLSVEATTSSDLGPVKNSFKGKLESFGFQNVSVKELSRRTVQVSAERGKAELK